MNNNDLGKALKDLRKNKGLTQDEAAQQIYRYCHIFNVKPITRSTLSNYENGIRKPDIDSLRVLAKFYGTTTDEIMGSVNSDHQVPEEIEGSFEYLASTIKGGKLTISEIAELQAMLSEKLKATISGGSD